jgi:hypothetical protein
VECVECESLETGDASLKSACLMKPNGDFELIGWLSYTSRNSQPFQESRIRPKNYGEGEEVGRASGVRCFMPCCFLPCCVSVPRSRHPNPLLLAVLQFIARARSVTVATSAPRQCRQLVASLSRKA